MTDKTLGVDKRWTYCPECGSTEIRHAEGDHKQCACCLQEWFADIDYTDVVRTNLGNRMQLRSSLTARAEHTAEVRKVVEDHCADLSRCVVIFAENNMLPTARQMKLAKDELEDVLAKEPK